MKKKKSWTVDRVVSSKVRQSTYDKLEELADKEEVSISNLIRNVLEEYLKKVGE